MPTAGELLRIDEQRAVAAACEHLRDLSARHAAHGVLVGLSGGIDSAVLAALAVQALGASFVHAMYLRDADSEWGAGSNVRRAADRLGVELEALSIEPAAAEGGAAASWGIRLTRLSPFANRTVYRLYRLLAGETPFVTSLRAGGGAPGDRGSGGAVRRFIHQAAEEVFYARHRRRRAVLEAKANAQNRLLLGAANRSEWQVGWFVKDGVDDLPHQPLIGLYKTQVRQLAAHLGVPDAIRQQAPSPDMMRGVSDEFALGMSYSTIDLGLDYLAGGLSQEAVRAAGVTEAELRRIQELQDLSRWKRWRTPEPPPVDGSRGGGLRLGS